MAGQPNKATSVAGNGAPCDTCCPFCGSDAWNWDIDLCRHLIADYGDGSDGDLGILCGADGSRCGNKSLDCLNDLERTVSDFAEALSSAGYLDGTPEHEKTGLIRAAGFDDQCPDWLDNVLEAEIGGDSTFRTIKDILFGALKWSDRLVETSAILGPSRTSSDHYFVWAADPEEVAEAIAAAMRNVGQQMRNAIERLRSCGWRLAPAT
jgi:hypothetical protein